ncbi:DNA alkylation repair protein [Undibacterium crateris]|uniref:DNA alkylation repair protein n=1 Tax=Undibacterium crateris TaxID=2528175 RepID=UPI00138A501C|nr:DNA alkylation repair protein [Undibacterium crateris]NDI86356.1 DNA alkylation repair protein [Undibacterium crateris]
MATINTSRLAALNNGTVAASTLGECLAVDQIVLLRHILTALNLTVDNSALATLDERCAGMGISIQVAIIGEFLGEVTARMPKAKRDATLAQLSTHPSDTVRSWAAFAVGRTSAVHSLTQRLDYMRPFAADSHFGVREWAWIAVRPYIAADLDLALHCLLPWTADSDPNIRRFACESTRPRGVWCEHIKQLKERPAQGEALLECLKADTERYVQNSVANWINDASKSAPDWAIQLCTRWKKEANPDTNKIITRALRTLSKKDTSLLNMS